MLDVVAVVESRTYPSTIRKFSEDVQGGRLGWGNVLVKARQANRVHSRIQCDKGIPI
jgi:hypothetical protein